MPLPNPGMDFTPFTTLPAAELDKLIANIEYLETKKVKNSMLDPAAGELGGAYQTWAPILVGWSGTPTVIAKYKKTGKTVHVMFDIRGTSNNATTTISLPFPSANEVRMATSNDNGSLECVGLVYAVAGSDTLTSRRGQSGSNGEFFTNWTNSGAKNIKGVSFTYEAA